VGVQCTDELSDMIFLFNALPSFYPL